MFCRMIRNRFKKEKEEKAKEEVSCPTLLNEFYWDSSAIAQKKLQNIPNEGSAPRTLSPEEQKNVEKVANSPYCPIRVEPVLRNF